MYVIDAQKIVKTFPSKCGMVKAVDNVTLQIKKGEIFGLLGVNGAGKSTLTNILSGLTYPNSGTLKLFGKNFYENEEEIKGRCNVATAYYDLNRSLTVKENLLVYAKLYGIKNPKQKIKELTEKFMLTGHLNTQIRFLSSGERTRMVIIKSLLNDPEILFLDECTVGLDPDMAEITRDYLLQYNKETKCTIIFTSHYMPEVERLCNRIAFLDQGKIIKIGNAKSLLHELNQQKVSLHFSDNIKEAKKLLQKENITFEEDKDVLTFYVKNRKKILYPLLEKFVKNKIIFDDLHLNKPTLEEYFIKKSRRNQ
ncbi:MAG: ABC transporter ATP-binding protein [Candidatus Woesearchaeota archaeon]